MNLKTMELDLYERLLYLKHTHSCQGIKSEFENEGSDYRDLILLRYITGKTNLKLLVKLGGVEAFTDLKMAIHLNADGVVIPMVESEFALIKSQNMIEDMFGLDVNGFEVYINIETKTAMENLDKIFSVMTPVIKGVTIGRSDLSYSYDKQGQQDSEFTNNKVMEIIDIANLYGVKRVTLGGGISAKTFGNEYLLDSIIPKLACIETRNVIFNSNAIYNKEALTLALEFERQYLKYKINKNKLFIKMDEHRFDTLMNRG